MSERGPEEVETPVGSAVTHRVQKPLDSRRARLRKLLRTPAGRQQALLLADILSPPVAVRRRHTLTFLE